MRLLITKAEKGRKVSSGQTLFCTAYAEAALRPRRPFPRFAPVTRQGVQPMVAGRLNYLGNVFERQGRLDEAVALFQGSTGAFAATLGADHPNVAYPTIGLGRIHLKQGRPEEALSLLREALTLREAMYGKDHPEVDEVQDLLDQVAATVEG